MPKAVQAEDGVEQHFEGLLKARVPAQVGLLVGKPSVGSRDLVLAAVPTPSADDRQVLTLSTGSASAAAAKGGRKATASAKGSSSEPGVAIELDGEGIAEHALQVAMMLPGGLAVLGLYLFAPESGYASCTSQLAATLSTLAADAAAAAAASSSTTTTAQQQELLLLHVDSTSRKFSMRACLASAGAAAAAGSLKPVPDFKFGPSLASLVPLRTCHAFDITLPAGAAGATLQALLADAAAAEAGRVMASLALLSGAAPAAPSQQLGDLLSASSAGSSGKARATAWVDLYCSPPPAAAGAGSSSSSGNSSGKGSSQTAASSSSSYVGSVRLQGCIQALAYAHRRDSAAKALTELKQDVAASLAARLAAVADEALAAAADAADAAEGAAAPAGGSPPAHPLLAEAGSAGRSLCGLPRRVLLPWADLGLQVCAYLADDEGAAAAVERAQQLLPLPSLTAAEVQEVEAPAVCSTAAGGSAVKGSALGGAGGGGGAVAGCGGAVAAAAAAGAVAAVSVALAYLNLGQQ